MRTVESIAQNVARRIGDPDQGGFGSLEIACHISCVNPEVSLAQSAHSRGRDFNLLIYFKRIFHDSVRLRFDLLVLREDFPDVAERLLAGCQGALQLEILNGAQYLLE